MKLRNWLLIVATIIVLVGCSEGKDATKKESAENVLEENTIGFEMSNGVVEEAQNIPSEEKTEIMNAFNEYIDAFNAQNIERYMDTLSKEEKGFNLAEERKAAETAFNTYEIERIADDVTITKFSENEANVYATLTVNLVERSTEAELTSVGRQVTVLTKESGEWKIASIYYIGNE
jgi:ketosteroid isomerase-like protein